ncbi:MAG: hypothetical protein H7A25_16575 [Leptospiraceae bacterium]|nr:hypothetical protein [Leptospiraceae bacterium]MCP5501519.1 hypothetical protein [Leptospiraceae bacterium]
MRKLALGLIIIILSTVSVIYGIHFYIDNMRLSQMEKLPLYELEPAKVVSLSTGKNVSMSLKNVNFRFTPKIYLNIHSLEAELRPKEPARIVNFDDLNSFHIEIFAGEAFLHSSIMKHIFKDIIFNYPNSPLKLESLELLEPLPGSEASRVKLSGEVNFMFWLKFTMYGIMELNKSDMSIRIKAERMDALYNPYTKQLLGLVGLDMEKLLKPLPPGRGLVVNGNTIIVNPFSLFPPPSMYGKLESLKVKNNGIVLKFERVKTMNFPSMPSSNAKNYLFLFNGDVKFGQLVMNMIGNANMEMVDSDPSDIFDFYLKEYFNVLTGPGTRVIMQSNKSILVEMMDYDDSMRLRNKL